MFAFDFCLALKTSGNSSPSEVGLTPETGNDAVDATPAAPAAGNIATAADTAADELDKNILVLIKGALSHLLV